jgi:hypothetical protein
MKRKKLRNESGKRRGRRSVIEQATERLGPALNESIESRLVRGIVRHLFTTPRGSLHQAYESTLADEFCDGCEVNNGVFGPILKPEHEVPSFWQFRYVVRTFRNQVILNVPSKSK